MNRVAQVEQLDILQREPELEGFLGKPASAEETMASR